MVEDKSAFKILTDKTDKKQNSRKENIRTNLKGIFFNEYNWIDSAQIGIIGEPL